MVEGDAVVAARLLREGAGDAHLGRQPDDGATDPELTHRRHLAGDMGALIRERFISVSDLRRIHFLHFQCFLLGKFY